MFIYSLDGDWKQNLMYQTWLWWKNNGHVVGKNFHFITEIKIVPKYLFPVLLLTLRDENNRNTLSFFQVMLGWSLIWVCNLCEYSLETFHQYIKLKIKSCCIVNKQLHLDSLKLLKFHQFSLKFNESSKILSVQWS